MATLHITPEELVRDVDAVLAQVQQGAKVVIERDHEAVAVMNPPAGRSDSIRDSIARAKAFEERLGYAPLLDAEFAADVQAGIDAHREPLDPPSWD